MCAANGELGFGSMHLLGRAGQVVVTQHGEVGELARGDGNVVLRFATEPGAAVCAGAQRWLAREGMLRHGGWCAADRLAGGQPVETGPRVMARDARAVPAGDHGQPGGTPNATDKPLVPVGHAMLDADAGAGVNPAGVHGCGAQARSNSRASVGSVATSVSVPGASVLAPSPVVSASPLRVSAPVAT